MSPSSSCFTSLLPARIGSLPFSALYRIAFIYLFFASHAVYVLPSYITPSMSGLIYSGSPFESRLHQSSSFQIPNLRRAGAGSADFRRFIQQFRENSKSQKGKGRHGSDQPSSASNRRYYEMIWEWLRHHQDVQIVYGHEPRDLSLTEFETLELQETGTSGADYATEQQLAPQVNVSQAATTSRPCRQLHASIKGSLRERLVKEGHLPNKDGATYSVPKVTLSEASQAKTTSHLPTIVETRPTVPEEPQVEREQSSEPGPRPDPRPVLHRRFSTPPGTPHHIQRRPPKGLKKSTQPIFDEIPASTSAPRIKVSQERTWQAVAGHPVDLKKLSAMQFILLSIIAAHGADGIQQPELVRLSGQDKRSVPHRTDELAKAGYIEKTPICKFTLSSSTATL